MVKRSLTATLVSLDKTMAPIEKYKGRLRTEGHFGLLGTSDPVSFRNVRIKRL